MGIFLFLVSLVFLLLSIVSLFKPSIFRQKKRVAAFFIGIFSSLLCSFLGAAADGAASFWVSLIPLAPLIYIVMASKRQPQKTNDVEPRKPSAVVPSVEPEPPRLYIQNSQPIETIARKSRPFDPSFKDWDSTLTTVWADTTPDIEFTYTNKRGDKTRRKVTVDEVLIGTYSEFYIKGYCHVREELRTFKVSNIDTMIKIGSKRLSFEDWCEQMLGVDVDAMCQF